MLDVSNISLLSRYLADQGFADDPGQILITPLTGGVSNTVLKVQCPKGDFVLKQALRKLKVRAEWISDLERINVEKQVLRYLAALIPGYAPALVWEDDGNFLFMMESAPEQAQNWKQLLMKGELRTSVARMCGQFLGLVHERTNVNRWKPEENVNVWKSGGNVEMWKQPDNAEMWKQPDNVEMWNSGDEQQDAHARASMLFAEKRYFHQLRIEPFFEHLRPRHPELATLLNKHIEKTWSKRQCLVFGDYSPKNILVWDDHIMPIDFEVAHMGDPSFDVGFITCHLLLKSIHFPGRMQDFHGLVREVLDGYFSMRATGRPALEAEAVQQLGFLMLARVDGKSPVEYIVEEEEKEMVRRFAYRILRDGMQSYAQVMDMIRAENNNYEDQ